MPQMAPIMWLDLFIIITLLLILVKSILYFTSNKTMSKIEQKKSYFNTSWLW